MIAVYAADNERRPIKVRAVVLWEGLAPMVAIPWDQETGNYVIPAGNIHGFLGITTRADLRERSASWKRRARALNDNASG